MEIYFRKGVRLVKLVGNNPNGLFTTAAKGILDRQGIAKVRHIDVNCLWLQERCAKKIVPTEDPRRGELCRPHDQAHTVHHDPPAHEQAEPRAQRGPLRSSGQASCRWRIIRFDEDDCQVGLIR